MKKKEPILSLFKIYLTDTKKVKPNTVKNYLGDLRHFLSWLRFKTIQKRSRRLFFFKKKPQERKIIKEITPSALSEYKNFLLANKTAKSTINRKLAAIRVFCQFCYDNGLLEQNPAINLTNLSAQNENKEIDRIVSRFGSWLKKHHASRNTIKNYTADIRQYLSTQRWT